MNDIILALREALDEAIASVEDDDAWYLAMHKIRFAAWLGKELIHTKRLAEHERTRIPLATKSPARREYLPVSTLEDMLK